MPSSGDGGEAEGVQYTYYENNCYRIDKKGNATRI